MGFIVLGEKFFINVEEFGEKKNVWEFMYGDGWIVNGDELLDLYSWRF